MDKEVGHQRNDPGEQDYAKAERVEKSATVISWIAAVAFAVYVLFHHNDPSVGSTAKICFVTLTAISLILSYYHRFVMLPHCERRRRLMLISNSMGINLGVPLPREYWTNTFPTSARRFVLSLMENTYFYPRLLSHEIPAVFALVGVLAIALVMSIRFGSPEMIELFAVILLFSDVGIGKLIRVIWATQQFGVLYTDCCAIWRCWPEGQDSQQAELMRLFGEYESIKARSGARASDRTFKKLNPKLTAEWKEICDCLESESKKKDETDYIVRKAEENAKRGSL